MGREHTSRCNWIALQGSAQSSTLAFSSIDRGAVDVAVSEVSGHPAHNNTDREGRQDVQADREKPSYGNAAGSTDFFF